MWADAQRDGRAAEYRWRLVRKFRNYIPCTTKFGWRPLVECRAVLLPIGERKTLTQSEVFTWQNSVRGQKPLKDLWCISSGDGQTSCKVWLASGERRGCINKAKTRNPLKFVEVPQTRQQISAVTGRGSPYCEDMWRRYCCWTSVFPIVDIWLSCAMVRRWWFLESCISSEPRAAHFRPAF